jgi:hypothetical protein
MYKVIGEPIFLSEAQALAKDDPYQFQCWALGLVGVRQSGQKKDADKGIDPTFKGYENRTGIFC